MINGAGIFYVGDFDLMLYLEKYDFDLNLLERVFIGGGNPNNEYGISLSSFRNNETLVGGNYVHTMDVGQFVAPGDDSQFRILLARWGCSLGSDSDDCINQVAEQSPFFIYPNPTDGELNLSITGKIDSREVTVFYILGRKVFYRKSEQETELTKIDISMLPSGTYVVLLNGNIRDWAALKFVKQ